MQKIIDIRSDTKTKPNKLMYQAMLDATLGDEQNEEDPTVVKLQEMAAQKLGKEDALFLASGTMGNLVALMTHSQPGDSVIMEEESHILRCETGGLAAVAGLMLKTVPGQLGFPKMDYLRKAIIGEGRLFPTTRLICLENTHNAAGGTCINIEQMKEISNLTKEFNIKIHIDGARIFNAVVALNVDPVELVKEADSIQFCLSKSLGCPFGSLLVGDKDFISRARKKRQMLGGGMRQAGLMAAAGIIGLEKMIDRLKEDHDNARILAEGLVEAGMKIDMKTVQTNMVYFEIPEGKINPTSLVERLKKENILIGDPKGRKIRIVTHKDISRDEICYVISKFKSILSRNRLLR
ncbi:MAG TPA: GntG family PLP-dependent aldolase [Atribacterota bacterium]|nr:GntG family PLP-dependent aldolase [Atribacterota bacterium]